MFKRFNDNHIFALFIAGLLSILLIACSSKPVRKPITDAAPDHSSIDWSKVKPVVPKLEPKSRYGNPDSYEQNGRRYKVLKSAKNYKKTGIASWYGTKFHGRRTSSGEIYDMLKMTAAHKTLPLPTYVKVTNLKNGKKIIVRVNDRGPFKDGRIIDLSYAAAHKLGMTNEGIAKVKVEAIDVSRMQNKRDSKANSRYVQVGAYSSYKTAQRLAKVLDKEINLPVKITSVRRSGKKLYRVRIGPVPNQELAEELLQVLDIKELGKPKIVYE